MQNLLNRRMFARPIRAAEGVYVPTLEDILQFYEGGFDASGQPIDQEALAQATELATILGTPANKDNSQFILDPVMAEKYKALGANVIPDGFGAFKFGENLSGSANVPPISYMEGEKDKIDIDNIPQEGVKIDENLTVFNSENLPADLQTEVDQKNKIEDEYAQRQLDIANQKELFEKLKNTGIKNLAGDTTQPITGDENIEIIKRNIMQGTNLVERGTPEYEALSATDKMKIDDQTSQFKRQEVDLTDVSEKGMQNIIDAAGSSAETAMLIYNDMLNAGGEVAEAAGEMLEGWKNAYTKGFSEDQKKSLNEQLDYLKEKSSGVDPDKLGPPVFGIDMETLKKGAENMNEWYKGTILPEIVEGGVDMVQSVFGAKDMGDGTLSEDQLKIGAPAITVEPGQQSGVSEEQDKAIDLADRPPSIVEDVSFKTKIDEKKNEIKETIDDVKESVITTFPEIKDKVTEQINILQEKLKNNTLTFEEYQEKIGNLKDTIVEKITDADIKGKVINLFDETVKKAKDFFTKEEPPSELDNITAGVSEEGDKKVDLASRADVETPIKDEEVEKIDETIAADKDTVTSESEGAGTVAANESAGSGSGAFTDGSMNVQNMIEETAKQSGYNFKGLEDTKDDLALKTMMYGLELFLTPGSFSEAVGNVAKKALTNEINQRYKTKAAQAKFRGELFKTLLAGKMDIEKELVKLRGKKTDFKTYTYDDNMLNASVGSWIKSNLGIDIPIEFPDGIPKDKEGKAAYLFLTKFKQEVQKIGNNRKTEGTEDPSIDDELLIEAYNNISSDFKANKAELSAINKIFNWVTGKTDAEIEQERIEKGSLETSDAYKRKLADATNAKIITEPMIQAAIDNNPNLSLTREDVIKALKNDPTFSTWDYSRVT